MDKRIDQTGRIAFLHSEDDTRLGLVSLKGHEAVNDLYALSVVAHSPDPAAVRADDLLGKGFRVEVATIGGEPRWFGGLATSVTPLGAGPEGTGANVQIVLRPWLWMASLHRRSRIFEGRTVAEVISEVLNDYLSLPHAKVDIRTSDALPVQTGYTVQYRESDLDFLCRVLERNGLNFHFECDDQTHVLVISDDNAAFRPVAGWSRPFRPDDTQSLADTEHFATLEQQEGLTIESVRMTDYDPEMPRRNMQVQASDPSGRIAGTAADYVHPAGYLEAGLGAHLAKRRMQGLRSQALRLSATGDAMSLAAGQRVMLTDHPDKDANIEYIALRCEHDFTAQAYRSGLADTGRAYAGRYDLVPARTPVAPLLRTPVARVHGPVLGTVTCRGVVDADELGRILVAFQWETEGKTSMRCRVAQDWAGNGWGAQFIPRVGMEVVVEFLDGDPDRPLVTGCVYNGDNQPAFDARRDGLHSGWRTDSKAGFNQISLSDEDGAEKITVHAQRDMDITILNDLSEKVEGSVSQKVTGSETIDVKGDVTIRSDSRIRLVVGTSSIEIDGNAIRLTALTIAVEAQGELVTKAGVTATHSGGAMLTIESALVKIN